MAGNTADVIEDDIANTQLGMCRPTYALCTHTRFTHLSELGMVLILTGPMG